MLKFDPTSKDASKTIRKIFLDDIARTLWMGIKQEHIVNQYFDEDCLATARYIKKKGIPKTVRELELVIALNTKGAHIYEKIYSRNCLEELLPYINGKKLLGYVFEI